MALIDQMSSRTGRMVRENSTVINMADIQGNAMAPLREIITTAGSKTCNGYIGSGMTIINDGLSDVTVVVGTLTIIVQGGSFYATTTGEIADYILPSFTSYEITATTAFRIFVKGV